MTSAEIFEAPNIKSFGGFARCFSRAIAVILIVMLLHQLFLITGSIVFYAHSRLAPQ
jgi:hypothetical protein